MNRWDVSLPLAITLGEPAGVGPEVTVLALCNDEVQRLGTGFLLFGPRCRFDEAAQVLEAAGHHVNSYRRAWAAGRIRFESVSLSGRSTPGKPAREDEPVVIESIRRATQAALEGRVAAVITAPIDKRALFHQGYPGWGHTELLGQLTGVDTPVMLLQARPNPEAHPLRVALITGHLPLGEVTENLSAELLEKRAIVVHEGLIRLGIPTPRIAVAALNPHCGERGELGTEELHIVKPAVESLRQQGLHITGPLSSDSVFVQAIAGDFDVVLALYHDQGMIPVKVYGFGHGVNCTLGIPIIRTSPDHGTAYDLAGTGQADPTSMIEAILLAARLVCS